MFKDSLSPGLEDKIVDPSLLAFSTDTRIEPPFIKVTDERIDLNPYNLKWEELSEPSHCEDSLLIHGATAIRILEILNRSEEHYNLHKKDLVNPNCHGSAMYIMGIVDYIEKIIAKKKFKEIYSRTPSDFSYEPLKPPVMIHLLKEGVDINGISQFDDDNFAHSVVLLGEINNLKVCFEKRGKYDASFIDLDFIESCYRTKHKLYIKPFFKSMKG